MNLPATLAFALLLSAQAAPPAQAPEAPKVRVNMVNVCALSEADAKQMAATLAALPLKNTYARDYEVARGRTTTPDTPSAQWVRVRREFSGSPYLNAQYSISTDDSIITETLVIRTRESRDVMQVALESHASAAGTTPEAVAGVDSPVTRIKIERFGKASITLARCEAAQDQFQPLFAKASAVMAAYRANMGVRTTFRNDVRRLTPAAKAAGR